MLRATVTEAHCFAEWLGGRLPTGQQWRKAAGWAEDKRPGPFAADTRDNNDLAIDLEDGPWPVDRGKRDVSIYDCRQMASNGCEWTRDLADEGPGGKTIPVEAMTAERSVAVEGQSYLSAEPLTFEAMAAEHRVEKCTEAPFDVTFRIVLE